MKKLSSHHRAGLYRPAGEIGYRPRFVRISETGTGLYILPWWRSLMSGPQPISGERIWLEFHVVRSGVDTGGHRFCSRVFRAVEIRRVHESGMGPYFPRVRRKCPPLVGLYPPRTALWSSNQAAISRRDWGFLTVQDGVDPRMLRLLPRLMEVLEIDVERPLNRGCPNILPRWSWPNMRTMANRKVSRPVGLGFPHRAGRYHVWMDCDPGT